MRPALLSLPYVMTIHDASMTHDHSEKRALSQPASPVRDDILRLGGKQSRIQTSPFSTPLQSQYTSVETLPQMQSFPSASDSSTHFVHGGSLASTGLALGVHDGVQPPKVGSLTVYASDGQSIFGMEAMIRQLFSEHKAEMNH